MIVRMNNGNVEDLYDYVAQSLIRQGLAKPVGVVKCIAGENAGAVAVVENATLVPKTENAFVRFFRTSRTRN